MATLQLAFRRDSSSGQVLFDANGYPMYDDTLNAGANTYSQLQARIAYEILGSPTTDDIKNAINDAIGVYDSTSFWFNNMRLFGSVTGSLSDLQTTPGKEFYSSSDLPVLGAYPHISQIQVLAFNNRYTLHERTVEWIDDQSVSTSWEGMPTDWCWVAGSLRIYPVPDGIYPLIITGTMRLKPLVNDSDYGAWTNEAEYLIRCEAKRLLWTHIIRDPAQASLMEQEINGSMQGNRRGVLSSLQRETMRRTGGPGRIRASRGHF